MALAKVIKESDKAGHKETNAGGKAKEETMTTILLELPEAPERIGRIVPVLRVVPELVPMYEAKEGTMITILQGQEVVPERIWKIVPVRRMVLDPVLTKVIKV